MGGVVLYWGKYCVVFYYYVGGGVFLGGVCGRFGFFGVYELFVFGLYYVDCVIDYWVGYFFCDLYLFGWIECGG